MTQSVTSRFKAARHARSSVRTPRLAPDLPLDCTHPGPGLYPGRAPEDADRLSQSRRSILHLHSTLSRFPAGDIPLCPHQSCSLYCLNTPLCLARDRPASNRCRLYISRRGAAWGI